MRGLGHLLCRNLVAFGDAQRPMQRAGMLNRAFDPMTAGGLAAGSEAIAYFPRAPVKAPPETSPLP